MSIVVATAGHVDHGKSTLVQALTGMNPDRLESEQARGLTIELGFAWAEFDGIPVAFVDVPGHEKFIHTMLSGIGAVPLALLVVAADDPWMPQTAEHLAALDVLGVRRGIVAVTRSDLADPSAAVARARKEIARTALAHAPIVAVSAPTGRGMAELREEIGRLAREAPPPPADADVRVWVDRKFTIKGSGTVVTATLPAGTIRVNDELTSATGVVRVRSMESLGQPRTEVRGSARVALNITGDTEGIRRGDALWTAGAWWPSQRADIRLLGPESLPPRTPLWHIGAYSAQVGVRLIDDRHAHVTFDAAIPLRQGDRAILRDPGDRRLWGAVVLDPDPAPLRGRGAREQRGAALREYAGIADYAALLEHVAPPDYAAEVSRRGIVSGAALRALGIREAGADPWHMSPEWKIHTAAAIHELVERHDRANPANPGLAPAQIRHALALPPDLPAALITDLLPAGLRVEAGKVTSRSVELPDRVARALAVLEGTFADNPFAAPTLAQLRDLGLTDRDLGAAARLTRIFLPAPGVVLSASAPTQAASILRSIPNPFTTSEARRALKTSRRVAIPVLEFLDRAGVTRRLPDDRREIVRSS